VNTQLSNAASVTGSSPKSGHLSQIGTSGGWKGSQKRNGSGFGTRPEIGTVGAHPQSVRSSCGQLLATANGLLAVASSCKHSSRTAMQRRATQCNAARRTVTQRDARNPLGIPWVTCGFPLENPWVSGGIPAEGSRNSGTCPLDVRVTGRDCPAEFRRKSRGCPVDVPCLSRGTLRPVLRDSI